MVGRLEVITGPMFSGKSEELIRRLTRAQIAGKTVTVFKPIIDDRYSEKKIVSHSGSSIDAIPIGNLDDIEEFGDADVIGIDEAQFFDAGVIIRIRALIKADKTVIVSGLDMTSKGRVFGSMPTLMALADTVTKLSAVCHSCGEDAILTQSLIDNVGDIRVGGMESYEARCRNCWRG